MASIEGIKRQLREMHLRPLSPFILWVDDEPQPSIMRGQMYVRIRSKDARL